MAKRTHHSTPKVDSKRCHVELPLGIHELNQELFDQFTFTKPKPCPIFYPTEVEFAKGPVQYIKQIREEASRYGICKIIPPQSFHCPFALDPTEFYFTPRTQRIAELEAKTRIKLMFQEKLYRFWDLQGVKIKLPWIEKCYLDIFDLRGAVYNLGGFDRCCLEKNWATVATRIGLSKNTGTTLRNYYEKFVLPYDLFTIGATFHNKNKRPKKDNRKPSLSKLNGNIIETQSDKCNNEEVSNSELKKLQVYGAGPKMPGISAEENAYIPSMVCAICCQSTQISAMLTCDKCKLDFHRNCMFPVFSEIPRGKWNCHDCVDEILKTLPQAFTREFGFTQSQKTYSLKEFGEMANQFKRKYFKVSNANEVPCETIEKEFWRIMSTVDTTTVEYGADLFKSDYGSGFPTKGCLLDPDETYVNSPWNLNNLPTLPGSIFEHMNSNIDGMIVPWMYVGMCFSAFCWHNEDHWTYSINYLHWGDPKTWYGIPGGEAELFERAMKNIAPELFSDQPDLLHQLVTACNPNLLEEYKVNVFRALQKAGEFVVTFPRSYHAGFNQGFNFAEAVNFATADWIAMGRLSVDHYSILNRYPVFSHDELVMKMADMPEKLDEEISTAVYQDFWQMWSNETKQRSKLITKGIARNTLHQKRVKLEALPDDLRQCIHCKTTCFLSALRCPCNETKLVCLYHYDHLCNTCEKSNFILLYGFQVEEIQNQAMRLREYIVENTRGKGKIEKNEKH